MTSFNRVRCLSRSRPLVLLLVFMAGIVCPPRRATALGPQATKLAGVIQAIDYKNKTLTFQPDAHGGSQSIGWSWATAFYADGKRAKAADLKAGTRVQVRYLSPLFGREYATRIEWASSTRPVSG